MASSIVLVHDYLSQRGGAERVVLSMTRAFPGVPLFTSIFEPQLTFPAFSKVDVRTLCLNRVKPFRRHHQLAFPALAPAFSRLHLDAEVVICSSSGWAHGARTSGRKIVYCHNPARWLYQRADYLGEHPPVIAKLALGVATPGLVRWDRRAAISSHRYLANSSVVRRRIQIAYGVDAEVLPPPPSLDPAQLRESVPGLDSGFFLCISRLRPYKNVEAVIGAFAKLPEDQLVIVGKGPTERALRNTAPSNVRFVGTVPDTRLRWLYANCRAVVAASHEDYGLTPVEAAVFGKAAVVLRWGGFLDTVVEGETGVFFDQSTPDLITRAIREIKAAPTNPAKIVEHARRFEEWRFVDRIRAIAKEEASQ